MRTQLEKHKDAFEKFYSRRGSVKSWTDSLLSTYGNLFVELQYFRRNAEILERVKQPQNFILDIGCGVGDLLTLLSKVGRYVVGAELTEANMSCCQQNMTNIENVSLCYAIGETLPFISDTFDSVVLADVIEHVISEQQTLVEIERVLRPKGTLILTTPNKAMELFWKSCDFPFIRFARLLRFLHLWPGKKKSSIEVKDHLFSPRKLRLILKEAGFNIVEHRIIEFYPRPYLFSLFLKAFGRRLRTRYAERFLRTLFAAIEKLGHFNNRQLVVAQKL